MPPAPPHSDAWQLADVIARLRRTLRTSIRSDYPWEKLPMAQVEILQRLEDEPGLRVNEIAERHRLAKNTVSQLVQQLVTAGLVDRVTDARDRRAVVLALTDEGHRHLGQWQAAHEERFARALDHLSEADRRAVLSALPALTRLVDELGASPAATGVAAP